MSVLNNIKNNTMGMIAALQTILERYPILTTTDFNTGKTSFSFMLNLLKMFGVTELDILEWLSIILADKKDGADGILSVIEEAIKGIILASFKETYTCSINPVIPDDMLADLSGDFSRVVTNGISIKIEDIDAFGVLSYSPTDGIGKVFYFDNEEYTPLNIYSSTDFNAFLWYVINKGMLWVSGERKKCVWDNRRLYYKKFEKEGCRNGEAATDITTDKGKFFNCDCGIFPSKIILGVGPKKEILGCQFIESGVESGMDGSANHIRVYLNFNRYYGKTIFEFNADYIASLKLFDTKTLLAQVLNAMLGITSNLSANFSIERNVLSKGIRNIIENIISAEDDEIIDDCYYNFSNSEYDKMLEEADLNYNGKYQSRNENNDLINIDTNDIIDRLWKIESTDNLNEETTEISNIVQYVAKSLSASNETPASDKYTFEMGIISDFINEVMVQIVLQILSPKIMLLYAINDKIMSGQPRTMNSAIDFLRNFKNLMITMIKKIVDIITEELFNYLISEIKPLITLFIEKILLEKIYYYKLLIENLMAACTPRISFNREPLVIEDVRGADIIPVAISPATEIECRK